MSRRTLALRFVGVVLLTWLLWDGILWWVPSVMGLLSLAYALIPGRTSKGFHPSKRSRAGYALFRILLSFALILALVLGHSFLAFHAQTAGRGAAAGPTALWLGHTWVGDAHSPPEYQRLADLFRQNRVTDAFFHVGPLDASGLVNSRRIPFAIPLLGFLRAKVPHVRAQAWLGQISSRGGGPLDLASSEVRSNIVETAGRLLDLGFSGIHYDIEPIYAGDRSLLALLADTRRQTTAHGAVLSIAAEDLDPFGRSGAIVRLGLGRYHAWTKAYFLEVSKAVDQIAVMTYDTALPVDWLYGRLVAWEVKTLTTLLKSRSVTLFFGIPTYEDPNLGHHPRAENVRAALAGVRKGTAGIGEARARRVGVAIFAEWTTSQAEWADYRRLWPG